ncbi:HEAT repeat domain-containing protein [Microcoleus sp. AR_TQ3_B6]
MLTQNIDATFFPNFQRRSPIEKKSIINPYSKIYNQMGTPVDFPKYLQSLVESYKKQQHLYTLTDLQVEVRVEKPPEDRSQPPSPENKPETKIERLEVLAGLRKYVQQGNVLLVGKPGSGKSTVLQRFRWELALKALNEGDRPIPVLVQLRSDRSIPEAIYAEFRQAKLRVSREEVDDLLFDGKLLLLLDGVNEMPSQQRRQELQLFHDDNPDTPMIFTTRDLALGGSLGIEKKLEMCALTEAQMREFVHKHLPQHGDLLLGQLRDRLREIAETPLLLEMMCKVFKNSGKIPQSKGELFQEFDRQYDEFKGGASVSDDFRRFKSEVLQQLAFVMLQGDSQRPTDGWVAISRDRAEGILECWLRDRGVVDAPTKAKEWLEDLLEHHLLQVAAKPEEIEFHHQLFQEYYAGRALLKLLVERPIDAIEDERLQHFYLNYFKWTEPLAFMLSLLRDEAQAVRVVRLAFDVDLRLGARLAGEVQRDIQKRTVGLVDGLDVPGWLKGGLLGEVRSDEAIARLLKLLEHSDDFVRWRAVSALGKFGDEKAIPGLLKLLEHSDDFVRRSAAYALGNIGDDQAIPGLLKLVEEPDYFVRWSAADALGNIGDDQAIPGLVELVEEPDYFVRWSAAYAFKIGDEKAIPGLLKLLEDPDSDVRSSAADVLGKIGGDQAIPELLKLVEHSDYFVRWSAADALGKIGDDQAIPGLLKLVEDSDSDVRSSAADALGKIGDEKAIPGLLKLVEDSDSGVRWSAADALGNIAKHHTEKVALHLPELLNLIPSESGKEVHRAILAIQAACKYYNYPIHQLSLAPHPAKPPQPTELLANIDQTTQQIHKRTKQMADQPTQDFSHATFQSPVIFGTNHGYQAHHLHIAAQQSSPEAALNAVVQIIQALEKKYTNVQDEQQARIIIDAKFKEIKEQKRIEWQNLISLQRLYNGGKNAAVKVGEHFAESSVWGKAGVGFIEGISEDVN